MLRFALAGAFSAAVVILLVLLPQHAPIRPGAAMLEAPPAEARPPGLRHSIVWLTELPQYQYARREALKHGLDFRSRVDQSLSRASDQQRYRLTVLQRPQAIELGEFQSWLLHVEDDAHHAVPGATLTVSGGMPQHGHGLPSRPRIVEQGVAGDYRIDGLQFSMPGWWEVKVYVSKNRVEDTAVFNVFID